MREELGDNLTAQNSAILHELEVKYNISLSTQYVLYIFQTLRRHFRYNFDKVGGLRNHVFQSVF